MNRATRIIVSTLGCLVGLSGMNHGFFETLQGNTPTSGLIVQAIGAANRMWLHGTEEAFTIVPNFLITGLLAMTVGLAIIVWSIGFVHRKNGPLGFILLCLLLFLVGGGIGQVVFFAVVWAFSTQINQPLTWWRGVLSNNWRSALGKWWPGTLVVASLLFLMALEIAIAGVVPGMNDPEQKLYVCWSLLVGALGMIFLTFVAGFARDIQA